MNKKILIFSGDPNSINSEIILKCWRNIDSITKKRIYLITNYELIKSQLKRLGYSSKIEIVKNLNDLSSNENLKILNIDLTFKDSFNVTVKECKKFIKKSLNLAHKLSLDPLVSGLINCPINKNLLGNKKGGLTEFFAKKCRSKKNSEVMLISNEKFSVCPITTHIDLQDVSKRINGKVIIEKIKTIDTWYKKIKKKKSKICLLGLNPHNSEFRKNSIEQKIIIPTIKKLVDTIIIDRKASDRAYYETVAEATVLLRQRTSDDRTAPAHDERMASSYADDEADEVAVWRDREVDITRYNHFSEYFFRLPNLVIRGDKGRLTIVPTQMSHEEKKNWYKCVKVVKKEILLEANEVVSNSNAKQTPLYEIEAMGKAEAWSGFGGLPENVYDQFAVYLFNSADMLEYYNAPNWGVQKSSPDLFPKEGGEFIKDNIKYIFIERLLNDIEMFLNVLHIFWRPVAVALVQQGVAQDVDRDVAQDVAVVPK